MVACILNAQQCPATEFTLVPARNQITGDKHPDIMYLHLPGNPIALDRIYEAQPFFKYMVAHKLAHLSLLPLMKPVGSGECLICTSKKEEHSPFDLCVDCLVH